MSSFQDSTLTPTPKQVAYAHQIAQRLKQQIPMDSANDRRALSDWIAIHQAKLNAIKPAFGMAGATSKQVAYAEKIARRKRLAVPDECFRDAGLMSRWISSNR